MSDTLKTDLRLAFTQDQTTGEMIIDLAQGTDGLQPVSAISNLEQALIMRLLVDQGDLGDLAHPRYGSRISDLIGETLDRANLELMRRYVKQALLTEPRVLEVLSVSVTPRPDTVGVVDVSAHIRAIDGNETQIGVSVNAF